MNKAQEEILDRMISELDESIKEDQQNLRVLESLRYEITNLESYNGELEKKITTLKSEDTEWPKWLKYGVGVLRSDSPHHTGVLYYNDGTQETNTSMPYWKRLEGGSGVPISEEEAITWLLDNGYSIIS